MSLKFPHIPTSKTFKGAIKKMSEISAKKEEFLPQNLFYSSHRGCLATAEWGESFGMECEFSCPQTVLVLCFCRSQSISESTNFISVNQLSTLPIIIRLLKQGLKGGRGGSRSFPLPFHENPRPEFFTKAIIKVNVRCRLAVTIVIVNLHVF